MADAVAEAKQLQEAGDTSGAYDLLKKTKADLDAKLKKNKAELKSQLSALSKVSSMEEMDAIKKRNAEIEGERKGLLTEKKKVDQAISEMASLMEFQPYKDKDTAEAYAEFLSQYPESPFAGEAAARTRIPTTPPPSMPSPPWRTARSSRPRLSR